MRTASRLAGLARQSQRTALHGRCKYASQRVGFSVQAARRKEPSKNPELPSLSFEGLGISRNMKFLLFGILGVFGTMETWVYCKWIYRWWYGAEESS